MLILFCGHAVALLKAEYCFWIMLPLFSGKTEGFNLETLAGLGVATKEIRGGKCCF